MLMNELVAIIAPTLLQEDRRSASVKLCQLGDRHRAICVADAAGLVARSSGWPEQPRDEPSHAQIGHDTAAPRGPKRIVRILSSRATVGRCNPAAGPITGVRIVSCRSASILSVNFG
jgi:hypothetical protein